MPPSVRIRQLVLLPVLTLALLAGVTTLGPLAGASAASQSQRVARAESVALHQVGDPYRYGAAGPGAFDCSGLMQYSFRMAGIKIPRTAAAQARHAHRISKRSLRPGDLMFFARGGRVYHTAMFLRWRKGHAVMVDAPGRGKRVRVENAWTNGWFAATLRR